MGDWTALGGESAGNTCLHFDNAMQTLFAGTIEGFLYLDLESGFWMNRQDEGWIGREVRSVATCPDQPGHVLTGRVNAFFKGYIEFSPDWGVNEEIVHSSTGGVIKDVQVDPFDPEVFYACGWQDVVPGELLKSEDGGQSWTLLPDQIHYTMTEIAMDRLIPDRLFVSGDQQVTRSLDGGLSWEQAAAGLPTWLGVYCVAVSPGDSQVLLASNDDGIFRSTDGADTWIQVDARDSQHFAFYPAAPEIVAAVTFSPYSLLVSTDAGLTWTDCSEEFPGAHMTDLVFSDDGQELYVSSVFEGVYSRTVELPDGVIHLDIELAGEEVLLSWTSDPEWPLYYVYRSHLPYTGFQLVQSTSHNWFSEPRQLVDRYYRVTGTDDRYR